MEIKQHPKITIAIFLRNGKITSSPGQRCPLRQRTFAPFAYQNNLLLPGLGIHEILCFRLLLRRQRQALTMTASRLSRYKNLLLRLRNQLTMYSIHHLSAMFLSLIFKFKPYSMAPIIIKRAKNRESFKTNT